MSARILALVGAFALIASAALAHHPGVHLNAVMAAQEPAFEPLDHVDAPEFDLTPSAGTRLHLADFDGKVLVLSFVAGDCGPDCVAQQTALAAVQSRVNITPMLDLVKFVTVVVLDHPLPEAVISAFDRANWQVVSTDPTAGNEATYAALSTRKDAHPMTYVVDRLGRVGGIFHGTAFGQVNMVLYINGLSNDHEKRETTFWQLVWGLF